MAVDALDPGADNSFPYFPRKADGSPSWSDSAETDGTPVVGPDGLARVPMPRGTRVLLRRDAFGQVEKVLVNVTPTLNGTPVNPPKLL